MGNSKLKDVARKHRRRQKAAKEKVAQHLAGKSKAATLSQLAQKYLGRHMRVQKRG